MKMEFKKKMALTLATIGLTVLSHAQTGIGTYSPDNSARLDIYSDKTGLLMPRVALVKTTEQSPVTAPATSLLVYNTATSNDVTPGYYYWDGQKWSIIAKSGDYTFNNGLTANNSIIQLGGLLTQPSVLTTTSAFTLSIKGLQTGTITDNIVVTDANGVLKTISGASLGGGDNLGNHIATQDLNMSGKSILNIYNGYIKNDLQILDRAPANTNYFGIYKNNGLLSIWNNSKTANALTIDEATNNLGIGTNAPTNLLHVKATANPVKIEGLSASSSSTDAPIVVTADGTLKKGAFPEINIVPTEVGSVISVDGKLEVAQEITAQMDADFTTTIGGIVPIGNITNIIIDNKNKLASSSKTNSFSVTANGTYLITINAMLVMPGTGNPVIGIRDNNTGLWVARVNDYNATDNSLKTYTLITSINMESSHTYSFAVAIQTTSLTVKAFSVGGTGSGPISFFSIKRLK